MVSWSIGLAASKIFFVLPMVPSSAGFDAAMNFFPLSMVSEDLLCFFGCRTEKVLKHVMLFMLRCRLTTFAGSTVFTRQKVRDAPWLHRKATATGDRLSLPSCAEIRTARSRVHTVAHNAN